MGSRPTLVLCVLVLVLLAAAAPGESQPSEEGLRRVQGYAFFAPGFRPNDGTGLFSAGGGVDWLLGKWFGVGIDGHFFGFWECSSCGALVITGNVGVIRQRVTLTEKWEPFARVGLGGAVSGEGGLSAVAFGGGTNYWWREKLALRFEFRGEYFFEGDTYAFIRAGLTF
jgi:hypothetical protein